MLVVQAKNVKSKPSREQLINWVLEAWDEVPEDLLRRGMETLILVPALAPLPPLLTAHGPSASVPSSEPPVSDVHMALETLDKMEVHDAKAVDLPDECSDSDSSESSESEESEAPPAKPKDDDFCARCERPVRVKNSVQCGNKSCSVWYHVGCRGDFPLNNCMLCH